MDFWCVWGISLGCEGDFAGFGGLGRGETFHKERGILRFFAFRCILF